MRKKLFKIVTALAMTAIIINLVPGLANAQESLERFKKSYSTTSKGSRVFSSINLSKVKDRQIIIRTKASKKTLTDVFGIKFLSTHSILESKDLFIVRVPEKFNYSTVLMKLKESPFIISAEPNYLQERKDIRIPNDEFYKEQWYLKKIGVTSIWQQIDPLAKPVVVAVLDTGVDKNHPDLEGQVLEGYNIPNHNHKTNDQDGHGTAVAGTIAAKMNNKIGIVGVNPFAKILPVRIGDEDISDADSIAGIYYAIKHKADIINLSYGGPEYNEEEHKAVLTAAAHGILVVAASGNGNDFGIGGPVDYPAAYPTVLSVGSTNKKNIVSRFSNYGPQLDLVAPGESIKTLALNKKYDVEDGTSFSAPIVSGVASLLKAAYPDMPANVIEYLLEKGATRLNSNSILWTMKSGYGMVNALNAFKVAMPNLTNAAGKTRETAKSIALNKSYSDKYDLPLDSDWYKLKVTKKMKIKVVLSAVSNMDGVIWMDKYSNGKVIMEKPYNTGKLGKKLSYTYNVTPGTYYFEILEANNHWSTKPYNFKVTEVDTTPPSAPKVNRFTNKDTKLTGNAEKGAKLILKKGKTVIKTGIATSKSTFSIPVKPQKAGTVLYITATDAAGNQSKATKIIVVKEK
ncbi:S8 family serine peptidase [Heyndrickxia sp. NPDC080065]|uniref:S8 family serine peptidase n=1 Tax=Heyndrickxia sp. NPDC080065 TaxID=3390568 RepID=UPI003D045E0B